LLARSVMEAQDIEYLYWGIVGSDDTAVNSLSGIDVKEWNCALVLVLNGLISDVADGSDIGRCVVCLTAVVVFGNVCLCECSWCERCPWDVGNGTSKPSNVADLRHLSPHLWLFHVICEDVFLRFSLHSSFEYKDIMYDCRDWQVFRELSVRCFNISISLLCRVFSKLTFPFCSSNSFS